MTDQELQQIARELSKEASPYSPVKVESPKGTYYDYTYLIEKAIKSILCTHCIVSREKVRALENNIHGNIMYAHDEEDWQEVAHYILDVMPRRFIAIFGKSTFEIHNPTEQ